MKNIFSFLIKLSSGLVIGTILIWLPSAAMATPKNTPNQIPYIEPSIEKVKSWGGLDEDKGIATAVDDAGNIYVTGFFKGTAVDMNPGDIFDGLASRLPEPLGSDVPLFWCGGNRALLSGYHAAPW